jgi:hypothetical protein
VYYLVDLDQESFHQRCYDPDCYGFRSPTRYLWNKDDYFDEIPDTEIVKIPIPEDDNEYFDPWTEDELIGLISES